MMNVFKFCGITASLLLGLIVCLRGAAAENDARTKLVLIAGPCEHSAGSHEAEAAVRLLKHSLDQTTDVGPIETVACYGWPDDESTLAGAATLVFTGDGFPPSRAPQPAKAMAQLERLMAKGCGIVCLYYATGLKTEQATQENAQRLLKWLGGYFAPGQSKGAFYENIVYAPAKGDHPILRGWKSFSFRGESYWDMCFDGEAGAGKMFPIASTLLPPEEPREHVVVWAFQRTDGGRSVGIAPPHYYKNWQIDHLRTMVLNCIVWSARLKVPAEGVRSEVPDLSEFEPKSVEPTWLPPKWRTPPE
jgi:type 1 glutamine amidotransferase